MKKPYQVFYAPMKTVVIWDSCMAELRFFVTDEEVADLDRCYLNDATLADSDADRIVNLVYDEDGEPRQKMLKEFPIESVLAGARVIVIGEIP